MRKLFLTVLVAFLLLSCQTDDMENETNKPNPFIGTWEVDNGTRYIFNENTVTNYKPNGDISWSGTYTYNNTHLTVTTNYRDTILENLDLYPNPFVWTYKFEDDWLVIGNTRLVKTLIANSL